MVCHLPCATAIWPARGRNRLPARRHISPLTLRPQPALAITVTIASTSVGPSRERGCCARPASSRSWEDASRRKHRQQHPLVASVGREPEQPQRQLVGPLEIVGTTSGGCRRRGSARAGDRLEQPKLRIRGGDAARRAGRWRRAASQPRRARSPAIHSRGGAGTGPVRRRSVALPAVAGGRGLGPAAVSAPNRGLADRHRRPSELPAPARASSTTGAAAANAAARQEPLCWDPRPYRWSGAKLRSGSSVRRRWTCGPG
jgi:hypothetical protein